MSWFSDLYDKLFWTEKSWIYNIDGEKIKVTRYKTDTHYGYRYEVIDD